MRQRSICSQPACLVSGLVGAVYCGDECRYSCDRLLKGHLEALLLNKVSPQLVPAVPCGDFRWPGVAVASLDDLDARVRDGRIVLRVHSELLDEEDVLEVTDSLVGRLAHV